MNRFPAAALILAILMPSSPLKADDAEKREMQIKTLRFMYQQAVKKAEFEIEEHRVALEKAKTPTATAAAQKAIAKVESELVKLKTDPIKELPIGATSIPDLWKNDSRASNYGTGSIVKISRRMKVSEIRDGSTLYTVIEKFNQKEFVVTVTLREPTEEKVGTMVLIEGWFQVFSISSIQDAKKAVILKRIEWTPEEIKSITR